MQIGRLTKVNIKELWRHEQYDFSNWLSKEENIELLNDILGLTLVDVKKEVNVGAYRCDIVAKDETSDTIIVIENQLEASDHDHLGKIITYASGLSADFIVWIVKEARSEHRSAIEWLNNNTNKNINFFLIELHAYKIGNSIPAPKFEVIEMPNNFIKNTKLKTNDDVLSKSESSRLEFWIRFNEVLEERNKPFNPRKPSTDHWYSIALGTSKAHMNILLVSKDNYIGLDIQVNGDKELFDKLFLKKNIIENEIGLIFDWQRLDDKKASRIIYKISSLNFDDKSNYNDLINTVIDKVLQIKPIFSKYLKELN